MSDDTPHPVRVTCPYCDYTTELHEIPRPGDFTVCVSCAQMVRFDAAMALQKLTPEDEAALDGRAGARDALELLAEAIRSIDRRDLEGLPKAGST